MLRMELIQKLILVCELCYIATKGEASLTRMMTDGCNHHGLSLYLEVCCAISNLEQAMTIKGKGTLAYIFCPAIILKDCPGNLNIQNGICSTALFIQKTVRGGYKQVTVTVVSTLSALMNKHHLRLVTDDA